MLGLRTRMHSVENTILRIFIQKCPKSKNVFGSRTRMQSTKIFVFTDIVQN